MSARAMRVKVVVLLLVSACVASARGQLSDQDKRLFASFSFLDSEEETRYASEVSDALQHGANINARNEDAYTPLMVAAHHLYLTIATVLINNHADLELKDKNGETALGEAVADPSYSQPEFMKNRTAIVRLLLQSGANADTKNQSGTTTLCSAVFATAGHPTFLSGFDEHSRMAILRLLLEHHADVNAMDGQALQCVIGARSVEALQLLFDYHADVNKAPDGGETPLMLAAEKGGQIFDMVMERHPDLFAMTTNHKYVGHGTALQMCLSSPCAPEIVSALLEAMLKTGMNPNQPVPETARAWLVRGNALFQNAQNDADASRAEDDFTEALLEAPLYAEAWNNLSVVQQKEHKYHDALLSLNNFRLLRPQSAHQREVLDRVYALQALENSSGNKR